MKLVVSQNAQLPFATMPIEPLAINNRIEKTIDGKYAHAAHLYGSGTR